MTAILEESIALFKYLGNWDHIIEENLKDILLSTWQEWGFEEIDEEFINFVLEMIKKRDSMKDVAEELIGVGLDEIQTKSIIGKFVDALQSSFKSSNTTTNTATLSTTTTKEINSSIDKLLAPLKTSRDPKVSKETTNQVGNKSSITNGTEEKKNLNRLLHSALSSARNNDNPQQQQQQKKGKRNIHETVEDDSTGRKNQNRNNSNNGNSSNRTINYESSDPKRNIRQRVENQPPPPPPTPPPIAGYPAPFPPNYGVIPTDPVQYFEHMNAVAIKSGFRNAQEMLSVFPGNPMMQQYPQYGGGYPYPPPFEQPTYQPPPFNPPRPHQPGRGNAGRATSTRYRREPEAAAEPVAASSSSEPVKQQVKAVDTAHSEIVSEPQSVPKSEDSEVSTAVEKAQNPRVHGGGRFGSRAPSAGGRFVRGGAPRAGGRFGGRQPTPVLAATVHFNPFAVNGAVTQSQPAAIISNTLTTERPAPGRGAGRGGGNKVWVRPGVETDPQES